MLGCRRAACKGSQPFKAIVAAVAGATRSLFSEPLKREPARIARAQRSFASRFCLRGGHGLRGFVKPMPVDKDQSQGQPSCLQSSA
jgi:hypothetical protein